MDVEMNIINSMFEKSNKWNKKITSYALKHIIEKQIRNNKIDKIPYISNDDLKLIMINLGFERKIFLDNPKNDIYKLKIKKKV